MARSDDMVQAKKNRKDEFYTQYADIQAEVNAYLELDPNLFKDKTVLLPCDDPEWSNFTKFFAQNFHALGLKKLISTSFATQSKNKVLPKNYQLSFDDFLTDYEKNSPQFDETKTNTHGKIFVLERNSDEYIDINNLKWSYLEEDGDFRSDEVKALRDSSDFIITNPPFSLFNEFIPWIMEANKSFLVLGNIANVTYRDVFPLIKENKIWLGVTIHSGDREFRIPSSYPIKAAGFRVDDKGNKYIRVKGVRWFTNLDHGRRHEPLSLMTMADNLKYSKHKEIIESGYIKYDNYDAIDIVHTDSIPSDYDGLMGVPASFLDKYNPDQFEIVASSQTGCHPDEMVLKKYKDYKGYHQDGTPTGRTGSTCGHNPMIEKDDGVHDYYQNDEGHRVQSGSSRIFIRRKTL